MDTVSTDNYRTFSSPQKEAPYPFLSAPYSPKPLLPGELEPSSVWGRGPRRASFRARCGSGAEWGGGAGRGPPSLCSRELGHRRPARPGLKLSCPRTAAERPPNKAEGGPGPSSHLHVPRTRPRQQGAGTGGERLPPCFSWEDSPWSRERGGPVLLAPACWRGSHPAERES